MVPGTQAVDPAGPPSAPHKTRLPALGTQGWVGLPTKNADRVGGVYFPLLKFLPCPFVKTHSMGVS